MENFEKHIGLGETNQEIENQKLFGIPEKYDYSKFLKDGYELDNDLIEKFLPIAKKLDLSQESLDLLLELALEMSKKQCAIYENATKTNIEKYDKMFKDDPDLPELNSNKIKDYMKLANDAYKEFCSDNLKKFLKETGLNYHPELIKMFHKIGDLMKSDGITYGGKPSYEELTPAQILYGPRE